MSDAITSPEKVAPPGDQVEIHMVFDYVIQRTPTRTQRKVLTRSDHFNVFLSLLPKHLDKRGYPEPRALWFAERQFLIEFNKKHLPDVRLLQWKAHLKNDPFVLSEYHVLLPRSMD